MNEENTNLKRPLFIFGFAMILAAIILMFTGDNFAYTVIFVFLIAITILCLLKKYRACKLLLVAALAFITATLSFIYKERTVVAPSLALFGETVSIKGTLTDYPSEKENSTLISLSDCEINGTKTKLKINLYCKGYDDISLGDTVETDSSEIFSVPDYNEYYYHTLSSGVWLSAYTDYVYASEKRPGDSFIIKINKFRHSINEKLTLNLGEENAPIAASLLLGDRSGLSQEFISFLRISGASHLFAVSGMHLSLWTAIIFLILRKRSRIKIAPNIFASLFVICYMIITGLSPSVIRAGIMLITVFIGKIIRKKSDPLNSLGLSACILLITNIYIAGNISFLLSFGATAGIITLYPYFSSKKGIKILNPKNRLISIKNTVFLSLSVLLFTAPISGFFFGSVSLLSPISSVVCSAPVSAVIITAFISLCTNAPFIYQICGFCCSALYRIIEFLSEFDFCIYPLNMSRIYIYYVILTAVILTVYFISKNNKSGKVILSVLICCTIMLMSEILLNYYSYPNTEIFISACGNATNICISSYNSGYNVLIGTGENYDDYSLMLAHMKTKGIFRFDSLIVPRDSAAESGMIEKYSKFYADNIYDSENFILSLKNNMTYKNISNSSFSAGILSDENIKIVFSFYPGGNFDNADEELLYGDYLVCRGSIPKNLLADNFDKIIVLSDKLPSELDLPENASTTAQTGDISIII